MYSIKRGGRDSGGRECLNSLNGWSYLWHAVLPPDDAFFHLRALNRDSCIPLHLCSLYNTGKVDWQYSVSLFGGCSAKFGTSWTSLPHTNLHSLSLVCMQCKDNLCIHTGCLFRILGRAALVDDLTWLQTYKRSQTDICCPEISLQKNSKAEKKRPFKGKC